MRLAPVEVMRRIEHGLPAKDGVPRKSELGTLRRQLDLTRPSMPIRRLLAALTKTFPKLAPCVLMSPLSVAQYLPADQTAFDVVIFDEASQITTWDAIGAIARGRQTIIVGDPKQLPPTNFFSRADNEDEYFPEIERDMPSILEEASAAGVPHRYLNWHYRSRDESLIAFSNHKYYSGKLVTFPAPSTGSNAIKFHKVNGAYARGQGRVNNEEAKAIAEMVRQRLKDWLADRKEKRQTIGIVTFNAEQQSLILDLLDNIRREDSELEWFFSDEREEPVIVKNLENIQGDERDVMLFSVTFGPDLAGKLTMNFGAINSEGGEKRLNVAITRARRELHVFSSIRAEQIALYRSRAVGVGDLKAFLDYADRGPIALPSCNEGSLGPAESPFEEAVADALRAKGWEVRTQIGASGFRVDLGVVHPDFAGRYLAGIECDGARYHSSATARDRDKVRQAVLEDLGWTIFRVWSTDWFRRRANVAGRLHDQLKQRLEKDREDRTTVENEADEKTPEAELPGKSVAADPDRFFDSDYAPVLCRLIRSIVDREGPITLLGLARRVTQKHGWQRTGKRIQAQVEKNLRSVECHSEFKAVFVWAQGSYSDRVPFRGLKGRSIREISRTEIGSIIYVHGRDLANEEDPILALSRLLGIARLNKDARAYLSDCAQWRETNADKGTY